MTVELSRRYELGVQLDAVSFPDKLLEAMGPPSAVTPELNPIARQEAIRYVNGLPRQSRSVGWFEPPPQSALHRESAIDSFLARVDRSSASKPELKLARWLENRRTQRNGLRAAVVQSSWTTREA